MLGRDITRIKRILQRTNQSSEANDRTDKLTSLGLFDISTGHDDKIVSALGKLDGSVKSQTRRGPGDDDKLSETDLDTSQNLGGFLGLGNVVLFCHFPLLEHGIQLRLSSTLSLCYRRNDISD